LRLRVVLNLPQPLRLCAVSSQSLYSHPSIRDLHSQSSCTPRPLRRNKHPHDSFLVVLSCNPNDLSNFRVTWARFPKGSPPHLFGDLCVALLPTFLFVTSPTTHRVSFSRTIFRENLYQYKNALCRGENVQIYSFFLFFFPLFCPHAFFAQGLPPITPCCPRIIPPPPFKIFKRAKFPFAFVSIFGNPTPRLKHKPCPYYLDSM